MTKRTEPEGPLWDMLRDLQEYDTLEFRIWLWREPAFKPQWQKNKTKNYSSRKTPRHINLGAHYHLRAQHDRNRRTT